MKTHRPINLAGLQWVTTDGRKASFGSASPGFGVEIVSTGELVSSDGQSPSCWSRKAIAQVHADHPSQRHTLRRA